VTAAEPRDRPAFSIWWLLPPTALFVANAVAASRSDVTDQQNGVYDGGYLAAAALTAALLAAYTLVAARYARRPPREALALVEPAAGWMRVAGVAFVAILVLNLVLDPLFHGDKAQGITPDRTPRDASEWGLVVLSLVLLGAAVPAAEELMFRGLAFGALGRYAVPGSAGLFAIAHALPELIPVVFLSGLGLAEVRRRSRSVFTGMLVHGLLNVTGILLALAAA
jgi:membrane protease YdiL (CAAX protease family)